MPCTKQAKIQSPDGSGIQEMQVCTNEGGYIHLSLWVIPFALLLYGLWLWPVVWLVLKLR